MESLDGEMIAVMNFAFLTDLIMSMHVICSLTRHSDNK